MSLNNLPNCSSIFIVQKCNVCTKRFSFLFWN